MTGKPVVLLPRAEQDIGEIVDHYWHEGGAVLTTRCAQAVTAALGHIGRYPASGSQRYAGVLDLPGLRFWPVKGFPHLVFYVERAKQVDVWRVLHGHRDIPAWVQEA